MLMFNITEVADRSRNDKKALADQSDSIENDTHPFDIIIKNNIGKLSIHFKFSSNLVNQF